MYTCSEAFFDLDLFKSDFAAKCIGSGRQECSLNMRKYVKAEYGDPKNTDVGTSVWKGTYNEQAYTDDFVPLFNGSAYEGNDAEL